MVCRMQQNANENICKKTVHGQWLNTVYTVLYDAKRNNEKQARKFKSSLISNLFAQVAAIILLQYCTGVCGFDLIFTSQLGQRQTNFCFLFA